MNKSEIYRKVHLLCAELECATGKATTSITVSKDVLDELLNDYNLVVIKDGDSSVQQFMGMNLTIDYHRTNYITVGYDVLFE